MSAPIQVESALETASAQAARRAAAHLASLQAGDGHWCAELTADTTLESDFILFQLWLDPPKDGHWEPETRPLIAKAARSILDRQLPDGGFNIYVEGPSEVSASVKAYVALKLAGVPVDDPRMARLRQRILELGGIQAANIEGKGQVPIRELVRNALRMRPDRIIVGECRGGEALDMLQAMNTGHDGSMSTGHANSPRDMLSRLETMVLMAGVDLPLRAIREQVASAVDLIVHQARLKDGTRRITNITEVQGMEGDVIVMQDVFIFEQTGIVEGKIQGRLKPTGIRPKFVEKFEVQGIHLPPGLFGFSF